jgi:prepilin-type N-terminal cleavage/methylation domain-containing protein
MTRRHADERGFTLTEVLVVMLIFSLVLGATLSATGAFQKNVKDNENLQTQAETARNGLDRMNGQLRNLAKRIDVPVINRATSDDFIFQTSDPTKTWVRWCVQPTSPSKPGKLWFSETPNASAVTTGMTGACPGTGWTKKTLITDAIANAAGARRVFTYACLPDNGTNCPVDDTQFPKIKSVNTQLYIDTDLLKKPKELLVTSTVFLRNQNEAPTADFSFQTSGVTRRVILNGAASTDPEQRTLRYFWYRGSTAPTFTCDNAPARTDGHLEGLTTYYDFAPTETIGASVPFTLVVCDPGDLQSRITKNVVIPA